MSLQIKQEDKNYSLDCNEANTSIVVDKFDG
jgi:hypothetical protein